MDATGEKYTEARRALLGRSATATGESSVRFPLHVQEAQRLGHDYVGCEHLLLGILADEEDVAAKILTAHGVTLELARRRIAEIIGVGDIARERQGLSYTPRATVVGKLAEVEAERLGELKPEHAHLLLAILTEGSGVPNILLAELEVDSGLLRMDLLEPLEAPSDMREMYLRQRLASEHKSHQGAG